MANPLTVFPIPAFSDNYIWCIHDGCHAVVVDPGDAEPVMETLSQRGLRLDAVLITHHHYDHVDGLPALTRAYEGLAVYGPDNPKIKEITHKVKEGDQVSLEQFNLTFDVFEVPGHTLDHIAYYANNWLFCGDTLFSAGCGRLFEGTPAQMLASLNKLMTLPEQTQVYCTHEYTLANLAFAQAVEPNNETVTSTIQNVTDMRAAGLPSLPSRLDIEKQINPFLRAERQQNWPYVEQMTGEKVENTQNAFAAIRRWKDAFKG
ncbi:hydroxyacylglutathione hydrolase [Alteromonas sediminis]|uniref:Hydroxyacylglutathione hydrolase n=1 Tax=Alteromonas sediminis TaxID=2259342 RepID=A0A3N5XXE7_9ALTE|nr:hydroxyacylglutathione hydrolase [Alteromonas sediminis]RPJ65140.1 hydroxyacylglutathione hydrolase [Alteromonas sediminis]